MDSNHSSGTNESNWFADVLIPNFPSLTEDMAVDVCVVGAGIAGLTTAYLLAREGKRVVCLDDGAIGSGETGRTSGHLCSAIDDRYYELERQHGLEHAKIVAESHAAAIDRIEQIIQDERIACDFERLDGFLFVPPGESLDVLDLELKAAHRVGLKGVELLDHAPRAPFDTGPCLRWPNQAQFQPLKYLTQLAKALVKHGGQIFAQSHVAEIHHGMPGRIVTSAGHTVTAESVVVATNVPINDRVVMHTKLEPYRTYVIAARIAHKAVVKALYWDTPDPYHYIRVEERRDADGPYDLLLVGGEDHQTGQADDFDGRFARLHAWMRERFPMAGPIAYRWSGQIIETVDGIGYAGRNPLDGENVFIITGDSGNGLTHGTLGAILVTDLIAGRENPWAKLYDPARKILSAGMEFAKHNANVALQYSDWLTAGDVEGAEQIARGEGAILRHGAGKLAVFRDEEGELHACAATCPHLGGVVAWNGTEKTWDCPLHGSRFDAHGRVVNGPANVNLREMKLAEPDLTTDDTEAEKVPAETGKHPATRWGARRL